MFNFNKIYKLLQFLINSQIKIYEILIKFSLIRNEFFKK